MDGEDTEEPAGPHGDGPPVVPTDPEDGEELTPEELREQLFGPRGNNREWLKKAIAEGFYGIDLEILQKDWLDY